MMIKRCSSRSSRKQRKTPAGKRKMSISRSKKKEGQAVG
jgi:hypothetical protein